MLSFPLDKYPEMELLDHMVIFTDRKLFLRVMKYSALPGCPTHQLMKRSWF